MSGPADDVFDVAILGAGSAGLTGADFAAKLGVRVALIEQHRIGGDCTCDRLRAEQGADQVRPNRAMSAMRRGMASTRVRLGPTWPACVTASARRSPVPGLADVGYATYGTLFDKDVLPAHLLVLGAGPIGLEMAQAYRRLGAEVTVIGEQLLPREEPEARAAVERVLAREGLCCLLGRVEGARRDGARARPRRSEVSARRGPSRRALRAFAWCGSEVRHAEVRSFPKTTPQVPAASSPEESSPG